MARTLSLAQALERTFISLVEAGRRDLVDQIRAGTLALPDVHDLYHRDRDALEQKSQRLASPELGPLVDEWLEWLAQPEALSPKTKAPYSRTTIRRYEVSWARIFAAAPEGRALPLKGLTRLLLGTPRRAHQGWRDWRYGKPGFRRGCRVPPVVPRGAGAQGAGHHIPARARE